MSRPACSTSSADAGIKTTFFVIGEKIAQPARRVLAERAQADGHWIGNHTFSHSVPLGRQSDAMIAESEIARTQALLGNLARPERLFRPFGGGGHLDDRLLRPSVVNYLQNQGYTCVLWNAIPRDWSDPEGWVPRALAQCRAQAWSLMVLHDLPTGAMRHLERVHRRRGGGGRPLPPGFSARIAFRSGAAS